MDNKRNICCIFNIGPHYRTALYKQMAENLDCDFYFGDRLKQKIKLADYSDFVSFKGVLRNRFFGYHFYWQSKSIGIALKYDKILIDGEIYNLSAWVILLLGFLLNKKVYLWGHGWYGREGFFKKIAKKTFLGLAFHNFVYGEYAEKLMLNEGFSHKKLSVIYNSLDYQKQLSIRQKLVKGDIFDNYFKNKGKVVIFIGRLTKEKKLWMLLQLVSKLNMTQSVNAVIVGNGEEKVMLMDEAAKLGVDERVWFYGDCYDEELISELLFNADVCISPGNVGLTAIHSLTYGCPVITHNDFPYQGPEFEVVNDGFTGTFYERNNITSLVSVTESWLLYSSRNCDKIRQFCYDVIDAKWNTSNQIKVLKNVFQK